MVKQAKPKEKKYTLKDEKGLYLEVSPAGRKWWRLRYRINKKENRISLGVYPEISLAEAQIRRNEARLKIAKGIDPSPERKKIHIEAAGTLHFENIAREWAKKFSPIWSAGHAELTLRRLELNIFPYLERPINEITASKLLTTFQRIEKRGALEVARRVQGICSMIFRYAVASGIAERDPSADLLGALTPPPKRHFASITDPTQVGQRLRDIEGCKASFPVYCALRLAPLVFVPQNQKEKHAYRAAFSTVTQYS